jgi:hypothetical protein
MQTSRFIPVFLGLMLWASTVSAQGLTEESYWYPKLSSPVTPPYSSSQCIPVFSSTVAGSGGCIPGSDLALGATNILSISTSTFTPALLSGQFQQMTLVHASCPCTIANPSDVASAVGASGMLDIIQSSTGSDTIGTWGSDYIAVGGISSLTLSTGASDIDHIAYRVIDSTHILLSPVMLNATH